MREECRNFESRTYGNGETVRKCGLELAPDAPWRCPADCSGYELRLIDAAWQFGTLVPKVAPADPPGLDDGTAAAVLDEAEDFLNSIGAQVMAEVEAQRKKEANRPKKRKKR